MPKTKARKVASLRIKAPGKMTPQGRKDIAQWLRFHAKNLTRNKYTTGEFSGSFSYFQN